MNDFYKRWFERTLRHAVNTVHGNSLGNYTGAYNTWKRLESIRTLFREEISRRTGRLHGLLPFSKSATVALNHRGESDNSPDGTSTR